MIYKLATPVHVGDLNSPLQVDALEISALSFNLDIEHKDHAILSVVLIHRSSGWKHTVTYQDAAARKFWDDLNGGNAVNSVVFAKLMTDKKLPEGSLGG